MLTVLEGTTEGKQYWRMSKRNGFMTSSKYQMRNTLQLKKMDSAAHLVVHFLYRLSFSKNST